MTDGEMAKEYYYKTYPVTLNIGEEEREKAVTDIFLAGLKAGIPQWHDLRKDPNDLPKEEGEYLVCYETECGNYRNTFILKYEEYDDGLHWCDEIFETFDEGVIAWCELPQFKE